MDEVAMKTPQSWIHLPVAAAVAGLVGYGSAFLSAPERSARGADGGPTASELALALAELRAEQARLSERLAALPAVAPSAGTPGRAPLQDLEQAIAAYMAKQLELEARDGLEDELAPADLESAAIADRIVSGQVEGDELEALWQKLRDEGRIDAVLAEIERASRLSPNNPDLQSELGKAYLQKLFDVGMGPMAAAWGEKADRAFDRALELDETHWEARFQKALALSNWPTFLGKQGESVRQFEVLMEQQERGAARGEQAWTYFFLGNLYDQGGQREKALATWKRGATRFPESEELRAKTEGK
jgi:tetratricopeptide (TPR) repeat protein